MTLNNKLIALSLMALMVSLMSACGSSPESLYKQGKDYFDGNGVPVNQEKAVYLYRKAAEKGHAKAQYELGYCYFNGIYFLEDKEEAVKWYTMAAKNDLEEAQIALADCYFNGVGVEQDKEEANKWYQKAAENRLAETSNKSKDTKITNKSKEITNKSKDFIDLNKELADAGFNETPLAIQQYFMYGTNKTAQKVIKGDVFDKKEGSEEAKKFRESHSLDKKIYKLIIPIESIYVPEDVEKYGIYVRFNIPFHVQYPELFKDLSTSTIFHSDTITGFDLFYWGENYYTYRGMFSSFEKIDKSQIEEKFTSFIKAREAFQQPLRDSSWDIHCLATHNKENTRYVPLLLRSVGDIKLYSVFTVKDDYDKLKKLARNQNSVFLEIYFMNTTGFYGNNPFLAFYYQESYDNLSKDRYLISAIKHESIRNDYMFFMATNLKEHFTFCYVKKMRILYKQGSDFEEIGFIENNSKDKPEFPYTPKWINILDGEKWKAEDINE